MNIERFEWIAKNPGKQLKAYLDQGRKVIGCFPLYTPEQLVCAAGMVPFGMWGADMEVERAKRYFPAYVCGILQTDFEVAMRGGFRGISAVMITALCDSLKCATQNWKYAVPEIEVLPVIHPQNRESRGAYPFLYEQYKKIAEKLQRISGREMTAGDLSRAIDVYNEHNRVMRCFLEMAGKYPGDISPLERSYVIKSGYFMDKGEHTEMVKELLRELGSAPPKRFKGIRVVTTGIIADSEDLLNIFKENRIAVAADEVAHESRQFRVDTVHEEDELSALVRQYLGMYACSTVIGGRVSREEYILNLVRETGADGVILLMTKFCDPEEYDYPLIKKKLEENHIPLLMIEVDKQIRNYGQAATAVQTFCEMIRL